MSSHWRYQLMKTVMDNGDTRYSIHEYYPMLGGDAWTKDPISVDGESVEDVVWMLKAMLNDIEKHGVKDYDTD